jgi:membrane protease YdiL (CAAX protease family)
MEQRNSNKAAHAKEKDQYTPWQILGIWALGGIPMWVLGWLIHPTLSRGLTVAESGLLRVKLLSFGLIWQFVLAMVILYLEEGNLRLETISRRFWLKHPVSPKTGTTNRRLWLWLIPLAVLVVGLDMVLAGPLNVFWTGLFPFLAEPESFSFDTLMAPEVLPQLKGAWALFWWFLVLGVFNTFLGEEFLYRGVLLPKMRGVFGKLDWVANGVLFAVYHIHQPWTWLGILPACLVFAFSAKRFRSNWFPIILHSLQTVFLLFVILGIVLGLA